MDERLLQLIDQVQNMSPKLWEMTKSRAIFEASLGLWTYLILMVVALTIAVVLVILLNIWYTQAKQYTQKNPDDYRAPDRQDSARNLVLGGTISVVASLLVIGLVGASLALPEYFEVDYLALQKIKDLIPR